MAASLLSFQSSRRQGGSQPARLQLLQKITSLHWDTGLAEVLERSRNSNSICCLLRLSYSLAKLTAFLNRNTALKILPVCTRRCSPPTSRVIPRVQPPREPGLQNQQAEIHLPTSKGFKLKTGKQIQQRLKVTGDKCSSRAELPEG